MGSMGEMSALLRAAAVAKQVNGNGVSFSQGLLALMEATRLFLSLPLLELSPVGTVRY